MYRPAESLLGRMSQQLYNLEKGDWGLWEILSLTGILVSLGILAIAIPAAFVMNDSVRVDLTISRPLAVGLVVLVALLNTYLVGRRLKVRRLREEIISTTLQKQVIEQQSFTDPLTEIYNRLAEWNGKRHLEHFSLSLRIGIAEWHDGPTLGEVLDVADHRMYDNKEASAVRA